MRKLIFYSILVLFVIGIGACAAPEDDLLIGTWRFINIEDQISDDYRDSIQPISPENLEFMRKNSYYVFRRNKTYTLKLDKPHSGQWWISENGTALNMKADQGFAGRATIRKLTEDELVIVVQPIPMKHIQVITMKRSD